MLKFSARSWRFALELAAITLLALLYASLIFSYHPSGSPPDMQLIGLQADRRLAGLEHERLAGTLLPVEIGLRDYGHIPAWNPYLATGTPLLNNAFLYLLNPFHSLPVLLLGGVQGTKIAIVVALLLAGYNMWVLARALGIGAVGRVFAGGMYLLAGGLAGKFWQGHFQLGLSLAWPPLIFAGLWWTLHTADRRAPALMAVAFALMFFAGNIYYTLHVIVCSVVITAAYAFERPPGRWRWDRLRRVSIGGLFALGLSFVQFWPVWQVRDFIIHDGDPLLLDRYPLTQAAANFIQPWPAWEQFKLNPAVDYAYIGLIVFVLIVALVVVRFVFRFRRHDKPALIALVLALLMMIWGAGQTPILQFLYANIDLLAEFRFTGRALAIAALWWIVLAALALDALWHTARSALHVPPALDAYERQRIQRIILLVMPVWLYLLVYSLAEGSTRTTLALGNIYLRVFLDGYRFTSFAAATVVLWLALGIALAIDVLLTPIDLNLRQTVLRPHWRRATITRALRWVLLIVMLAAFMDLMTINSPLFHIDRQQTRFDRLYPLIRAADLTPYPAVAEPFSPSAFDSYYHEMRNWSMTEGWQPAALAGFEPELNDLPRWAIVSNEYGDVAYDLSRRFVAEHGYTLRACMPDRNDCDLETFTGAALYELPAVLPYAFIISQAQLDPTAGPLAADNTVPATALNHRQDTITVQATTPDTDQPYYLALLETHFPGWVASIDGLPAATVSIGRYTGVQLLPGTHEYVLRYQPPGLVPGLIGSALALVLLALYQRWPRQQKRPPEPAAFAHISTEENA